MLIECPFCHAKARIAESKEGAKVRCGSCEKVYTAREPGARKRTGTQGTSIAIFVAAGVIALIALVIVRRRPSEPAPLPTAAPTPEREERPADRTGWDAAPVVAARHLFEAAASANRDVLLQRLDAARVDELALGESPAALAILDWKPFDGEVIAETDERATVRLQVSGRAPETAAETRVVELRLVRSGSTAGEGWVVEDWERYLNPIELEQLEREARAASERQVETVELSDGSVVREAEPGPIPFAEDLPEAQRLEIERELSRLIDFGLDPRDNAAAKARLVEVGAPALPGLLTSLFELPLETSEDAMRVNLVNQCLEEITGHRTGFKPQLLEGSATGTTAERRESALRQWFAWWHEGGHSFEGLPEDATEGE